MRFILQVKPEFESQLQEIAQKYQLMGVDRVAVLPMAKLIIGETSIHTMEELANNEWMASIREDQPIYGFKNQEQQ